MSKNNFGSVEIVFVLFIIGILVAMVKWTERTLEFWLTYWKGEPVDVPLWLCLLCNFALNALMFGVNVLSEVVRLIV